ncbi:MAG: DUF3857 domain-containing protein [Planctomycetota bacterium]
MFDLTRTARRCALTLAVCALSAAADTVVTPTARLEGELAPRDGEALVLRQGGWTVRVPARDALAVIGSGTVRWIAADLAEDRALELAARGKTDEALAVYRRALRGVLDVVQRGAAPPAAADVQVAIYLNGIDAHAQETGRSLEALAAAADLLEPGLPARWAERARLVRAKHLRRLGRLEEALAEEQALGFVSAFALIGPFDNERGTGFEGSYPPEVEPFDFAARYPGKGRDVRWKLQPVEAPPLGVIDLDALFGPNEQATAYALTALYAEADTEVALRWGSDEAAAVWVNGQQARVDDVRRPYRADQSAVGVLLRQGWNRVLLEVGEQTGEWRFSLRVTALEGGPAAGVRQAEAKELTEALEVPSEVEWRELPPEPLDRLASLAAPSWREAFHTGLLHMELEAHGQGAHPDRDALERACALAPERAAPRYALAQALSADAEFSVNREDNARRAALEATLALDPAHHLARLDLARYYLGLGSLDRCGELVDAVLARDPHHVFARVFDLELERARGLAPLARRAERALVRDLEAEVQSGQRRALPRGVVSLLLRAAEADDDVEQELRLRQALVDEAPGAVGAQLQLASAEWDAQRREAAVARLRVARELAPFEPRIDQRLARWYEVLGRNDEATAAYEAGYAVAHEDPGFLQAYARHMERTGNAKLADALYQRALELNPNLVALRDYLAYRDRDREREPSYEDPWVLDPEPVFAAAAERPLDPRRTHRVLARQQVVKLNLDGTKSEWNQVLLRVENKDGARSFTRYGVPYSTEQRLEFLRGRVLRPGGARRDARLSTYWGRGGGEFGGRRSGAIELGPLEPGDLLEVRYRLDDLQAGFFGDYYGEDVFFQDAVPLDFARYVVIAPAERALYFHTPGFEALGLALAQEHTEREGLQVHAFRAEGVPAAIDEPNQPWAKERLPQVQVSTFRDWDAFARWYWGLVKGQHEADPAIKAKVQELCAGATSDEEKIRRIYNYVVSEIRYNASWEFGIHGFKPYNATKIYARKFGDCKDKSTLINTMLREVGIDSYPVLIFGEDMRGREDLTLPLMGHFNHCISYVETPEGGLFVDGTAEHHSFKTLPSMDYGAHVVVVSPKGGALKTIPERPADENRVLEQHRVQLQPDGGAKVTSRIEGRGSFDVVLRSLMGTPGRRKAVLEPRVGRLWSGARVLSVKASDPGDLDQPLVLEVEVEVPRAVQETTSGDDGLLEVKSWLFDMLYARGQRLSALAADGERQTDLVLPLPAGVEETVIYELPEGTSIKSVPADVELETSFGRYRRRYTKNPDGTLSVERTLAVDKRRVTPAEYGELREFLGEVERAEADRPVLGQGADD